jgi:hypothetical protein
MSTLTPITPPPSKPAVSQRQKINLISKLMESTGSAGTISLSSTITESPIATPSTRGGPIEKYKDLQDHTFSDDSMGEKRSVHHVLLKSPYMDSLHIHIISSL